MLVQSVIFIREFDINLWKGTLVFETIVVLFFVHTEIKIEKIGEENIFITKIPNEENHFHVKDSYQPKLNPMKKMFFTTNCLNMEENAIA